MVEAVSFDVFETVLVRSVGDPSSVFCLLGRSLGLGLAAESPDRFAAARVEAERRARRRAGPDQDPGLAAIYRELAWSLRLNDRDRDEIMRREMALEAELLEINPAARRRLAAVRKRGLKIAFTSDTYLPTSFVEEQLRVHGLWQATDRLLVSCDRDGTKRGRGLFTELIATLNVEPNDIVHVGNNLRSDHQSAQRVGMKAVFVDEGNLTRDERIMEAHRFASGGLASVLAGAARSARLEDWSADVPPALRSASADVAAPTLTAYVLWVLREAMRRELETLYFLSREGQVLLDIARVLTEKLRLPLKLRYLHVSRQSLNLAALTDCSRPELAWALTHAESNTLRSLLARLRLRPEELRNELSSLGFRESSWDHIPDAHSRARLFQAVENGPLQQAVQESARVARTIAINYLEQERFLASPPCGIVDVSGVGSQFKSLAALRSQAGEDPAVGFLFLRSRDPYLAAEGGYSRIEQPLIESFFDDAVNGIGYGTIPGLTQMLELFCAADHGTVLEYRRHESNVEPVLSQQTASDAIAWGLPAMRKVIDDYVQSLWLDERYVDLDGDVRAAIREVLHRFWSQPSIEEAQVWGSYPFEGTSGNDPPVPLATSWQGRELLGGLMSGGISSRNWFHWRAASLQLSSPPIRGTVRLARKTKPLARRILRGRD